MISRKCLRVVHALVVTFSILSTVKADEPKLLKVFVDNSYPPYMYELEATEAEGLYPRLLEEAARQTSYELEVKAYPWKRAIAQGAAGIGAVGGAYKNNERLKTYDYSEPLYEEKLVLFVNKDRPFEFKGVQDLEGKLVGVNRGWSYGQEFDGAREKGLFSVNVKNSPEENFQLLALGRIDCVILDKLAGDSYIELLGLENSITFLPEAFSINNTYLIVPKVLNMKGFLSQFNAAIESLRREGKHHEIVQNFIRLKTVQPSDN